MELKSILEAVLFSSQKPLSARELRDLLTTTAENSDEAITKSFKKVKESELDSALEALAKDSESLARSYRLVCVAGAWQFVTQPDYGPWLKTLVGEKNRATRLSQPALETLAIIAYRQPVTRAEIEQIRGVNVDGTMQTLLERGLVEQSGRAEVVGRPALYTTTPLFLEYFGLANLEGLPAADELRKIVVQRPESLTTAEPGLATVPPDQLTLEQVEGQRAAEASPTTPSTAGGV